MKLLRWRNSKTSGRKLLLRRENPNQAFTYYRAGQKTSGGEDALSARSIQQKRQKSRRLLRMIPSFIAIALILISVAYSTTLSTSPKLVFIGQTSPYNSHSAYQRAAQRLLTGSLLNRNKLTLNTSRVAIDFQKIYPEFDLVEVTLPVIGRRPTFSLHARQPALILAIGNRVLVADSAGKIISDVSSLERQQVADLLTIKDESGLNSEIGSQVLTTESVTFITAVHKQLQAKKLKIVSLTLPAVPNQLNIRLKNTPYYIKADLSGDARLQLGTYFAARERFRGGLSQPRQYVDVRVEEKVFYK